MANSKSNESNIFVGLDIGTINTRVAVIRKNKEGDLDLIGFGSAPNLGRRLGFNIENTVKSIQAAVREAELMSGVEIKSVCAGIAGNNIYSLNSHGLIAIRQGEVTNSDVERVIESAAAVNIPAGYEVLHVLPQQFIVDNQGNIKDPVGLSGVRLEVEVHIVTGSVASVANTTKACVRAGLEVEEIYLEQLAASAAVLTDDEREIGVCLIDGGGGSTDMAVFKDGAVCHTGKLQIGGANFTSDVSFGLQTSDQESERIKVEHGCVWMNKVLDDEIIEIHSYGGRPPKMVARTVLTQILQSRAEEILGMLLGELKLKNLVDVVAGGGIVITGGMGNFDGLVELAESVLGTHVSVGRPVEIGGLSDMVQDPVYSTAVGLAILHAKKGHSRNALSTEMSDETIFRNVFKRMRTWFSEFF